MAGQGISIELGGKQRRIVYGMNGMSDIEEKFHLESFGDLTTLLRFDEEKPPSIRTIRTLLWAGLREDDESMTERQAGAMVNGENIADVWVAILKALNDAFPETDQTEATPQPATQ